MKDNKVNTDNNVAKAVDVNNTAIINQDLKSDKDFQDKPKNKYKITDLLKPYVGLIILLMLLSIISNGITLVLPKIISHTIDNYQNDALNVVVRNFLGASIAIFVISYIQGILQAYIAEVAARDLREDLINKISSQSYLFIQDITPAKLLTRLTLDIDNIKLFISQAIPSIVSSFVLIFGSAILLLMTEWQLALLILMIIPVIAFLFYSNMKKVRVLFKKAGEIIDRLNKVINENIVGSTLIRVLNSQKYEFEKFLGLSTEAKENGIKILSNFALFIPSVVFISNIATLTIFVLGGYFVIEDKMSLGDFSAFNSYLSILFFPILLIGFMTNIINQAQTSYIRISEVLDKTKKIDAGNIEIKPKGNIIVEDINLKAGDTCILKDINFDIKAYTKTAIIGPTGAGKTQLLYIMTGLINQTEGNVKIDNHDIKDYKKDVLHKYMGLVFQDNIMFNSTLRENICFDKDIPQEELDKALKTAELYDFVETLPDKLDTYVMERGTSLSGGQKQRIMLARVLVLNPTILLLDDFTARVDYVTERKITENLKRNYPDLTLISVTQNIEPVKDYDQIILLMEGELIDKGTHKQLMERSVEYVQIYNSQKSTTDYELHTK